MSSSFIKERLFRPFDTTKGNAGMGIGAFEAREFVKSYGGNIVVKSEVNSGTEFEIKLLKCNESD
jgi:signal transduction histidine kinase